MNALEVHPLNLTRSIQFGCLVLCGAVMAGCTTPTLHADQQAAGVEVIPLGNYGTTRSNFLLWMTDVDIRSKHRVDCYRVVYPSTDDKGKPIKLSGLLALPRDGTPTRLISWQHGTSSSSEITPSNMSTDGLAAALVFAGNGDALIAPDYIGYGVSKLPHPYYVATDTARAIVDMIHAVRRIPRVPSGAPFFIGFSEGGYASLAAHRALEAADQPVAGTAAVAGAFNMRSIAIPFVLKGESVQSPVYMALWVRGYATKYGHALDSAFTPTYAELVPKLLDTPHKPKEILAALPRDPRELFRPEVLKAIEGQGKHWLIDALEENDMGDWHAKAPIRLYFGSGDLDVPPEESRMTARQMTARGSDVQVIDLGAYNHDQSMLIAAPLILEWFQATH